MLFIYFSALFSNAFILASAAMYIKGYLYVLQSAIFAASISDEFNTYRSKIHTTFGTSKNSPDKTSYCTGVIWSYTMRGQLPDRPAR